VRSKRLRGWLERKGRLKKACGIVLMIVSVAIVSLLIARCPMEQALIAPP